MMYEVVVGLRQVESLITGWWMRDYDALSSLFIYIREKQSMRGRILNTKTTKINNLLRFISIRQIDDSGKTVISHHFHRFYFNISVLVILCLVYFKQFLWNCSMMLICFVVAVVMINSVFTVASGYRKSIHKPTIPVVRKRLQTKTYQLRSEIVL